MSPRTHVANREKNDTQNKRPWRLTHDPESPDIRPGPANVPMPTENCKIIQLPRIADARGSLSFVEGERHVPFGIERIYYLYDMPDGAERGAHAHKALQQLIVAIAGSFEVVLDDGRSRHTFVLDRPDQGLYICPMMWRELGNFSAGAVCMVLASQKYDENDYFRSYEEFLKAATGDR